MTLASSFVSRSTSDGGAPFNLVPYSIAGFGTLLVYDYLCTLSDEVNLIWQQPWNFGSILFLLNRYLPFIDTFISLHLLTTTQSANTCTVEFKTLTWFIVLGVFTAEGILMMRTYAIFGRTRRILIFLITLMLCILVPGIVVVDIELKSLDYGDGCTFLRPASAIIFIAYVLVLISESIIVTLTTYRATRFLQTSHAPIVKNLYRNGLLFYVYILLISLANVIVPVTAPSAYDNWLATPQRVLHSVFCTRILLSIRRDGQALEDNEPSGSTFYSSMTFGGATRKTGSAASNQTREETREDADEVELETLDRRRQISTAATTTMGGQSSTAHSHSQHTERKHKKRKGKHKAASLSIEEVRRQASLDVEEIV